MDTTGLAYRSKDRTLRWKRGKEERRVRGHSRLLALMRWEEGRRLLWPFGVASGGGYTPDGRLGREALGVFRPRGGVLLADAGFDEVGIWGMLEGLGVRGVIRLRGGGEAKEGRRVRGREGFDGEMYRRRGVVEGVCGGLKTRMRGGYLQERKALTAMRRAFLELVAYGLRVFLSLLPPSEGCKAIY
ncbi:IS5-like element ISTth7 family transposase [Thermus oshimai]